MRIISWNINGIKAHFDGLKELIVRYRPDIVCLQKVKSKKGVEAFPIEGYSMFDLPVYRSQWYGVGTYYCNLTKPLMNFPNDLAAEGHFQAFNLKADGVELFNVYTPFSNPTKSGFIEARKAFDRMLSDFALSRYMFPLILCGDFNVVDLAEDYFEPADHTRPCFYQWEIDNFRKLVQDNDLVDVYRKLHPHERGYTYFDSRDTDRSRGARIDYFLISRSLLPLVKRCEIIRDITVTNSNPLLLDIDLDVSTVPPRYSESSHGLDPKGAIDNAADITESIPIRSAARWLATMAASDGVISPSERKLLKDFAQAFNLRHESLYRMAYAIAQKVDVPEVEFVSRAERLGRMFEEFVVSLCSDKSRFDLIAWRSDKSCNGTYALENLLPDLQLRHRIDDREVEYYIECKYRSALPDKVLDLSTQLPRYRRMASAETNRELFLAIGLGGTPSNPQNFYLIPSRMVKRDYIIWLDNFSSCLCPMDSDGFHNYIKHYFNKRVFRQNHASDT